MSWLLLNVISGFSYFEANLFIFLQIFEEILNKLENLQVQV